MKKLFRVIYAVGFLMLIIGAGAMDSESVVVPMVMTFSGVAITVTGAYMEEAYT